MYQEFIAKRIASLRQQAEVSARDMSLTLGQADNYINHIENKKSLPSMTSFFYICEYFHITPQDFFDEGNRYPEKLKGLIDDLKQLDDEALSNLAGITKGLISRK